MVKLVVIVCCMLRTFKTQCSMNRLGVIDLASRDMYIGNVLMKASDEDVGHVYGTSISHSGQNGVDVCRGMVVAKSA